uniref:Uncharacterized protein n=1 Tax=Megaselia scalaris TaxID=36166 RepID=T1GN22_MEGSC
MGLLGADPKDAEDFDDENEKDVIDKEDYSYSLNPWALSRVLLTNFILTAGRFRQGDAFSFSFFNILIELIKVSANMYFGNIIINKSSLAADIVFIGRSYDNMIESFLRFKHVAESGGYM